MPRSRFHFTPVVFDGHSGGWGDSPRHLVTSVQSPTARQATSISNWLKRISSSLHRDLARTVSSHSGRQDSGWDGLGFGDLHCPTGTADEAHAMLLSTRLAREGPPLRSAYSLGSPSLVFPFLNDPASHAPLLRNLLSSCRFPWVQDLFTLHGSLGRISLCGARVTNVVSMSSHSSSSSEPANLPGGANSRNAFLDCSCHYKIGDILQGFWGWSGAMTSYSTCCCAVLRAPTCRACALLPRWSLRTVRCGRSAGPSRRAALVFLSNGRARHLTTWTEAPRRL